MESAVKGIECANVAGVIDKESAVRTLAFRTRRDNAVTGAAGPVD
jgi:hypothetical protein